jgi:hypothetical protein
MGPVTESIVVSDKTFVEAVERESKGRRSMEMLRVGDLEPVLKMEGVLRRGISAGAKAARPEHPLCGL